MRRPLRNPAALRQGTERSKELRSGPGGARSPPAVTPLQHYLPPAWLLSSARRRAERELAPAHRRRGQTNAPKMAAGELRLPRRPGAVRAGGREGGRKPAAAGRRWLRSLRQVGRQLRGGGWPRAECRSLPSAPPRFQARRGSAAGAAAGRWGLSLRS